MSMDSDEQFECTIICPHSFRKNHSFALKMWENIICAMLGWAADYATVYEVFFTPPPIPIPTDVIDQFLYEHHYLEPPQIPAIDSYFSVKISEKGSEQEIYEIRRNYNSPQWFPEIRDVAEKFLIKNAFVVETTLGKHFVKVDKFLEDEQYKYKVSLSSYPAKDSPY